MTTNNGQPPEYSSRLDRIEAIVAATSEQIAANAIALSRLEESVARHDSVLERLEESVARHDSVMGAIQTSIAANAAAIDRLEANQAAGSERLNILTERVNTVSESVNQVSRIAFATFQRFDAMQVEIHDLRTDVRGLQLENRRILNILEQRGNNG
ncbi:hypothetical protein [Gloeobacter violaceus]|nr:hypothetical protein [Gloeobacter violaceus]